MIIDCISDLHGYCPKLDGGDLLIVAGDLTASDTDEQHLDFIMWLAEIQKSETKYKKIIYIGGNHDNFLVDSKRYGKINTSPECNIEYLCDSGIEFEGLKIYGSPWTTTFPGINPHCCAFTFDSDEELAKKWELIPDDIDILVTHSPFHSLFDKTTSGLSVGSMSLLDTIMTRLPNLKMHVFGHIHECGGKMIELTKIKFVNASYVNERYRPVNKPIRVIL
jgi:Icc-related predicted phosphoesterase